MRRNPLGALGYSDCRCCYEQLLCVKMLGFYFVTGTILQSSFPVQLFKPLRINLTLTMSIPQKTLFLISNTSVPLSPAKTELEAFCFTSSLTREAESCLSTFSDKQFVIRNIVHWDFMSSEEVAV